MGAQGGRWVLAIVAVAALVVGPALQPGPAPVAEPTAASPAGAQADGTTASGTSTGAETLGPPDWPDRPLPPDAVPGRWVPADTSEPPNAAIGHTLGASGVLVSDYHVLTAAHVVTDDRGQVKDLDEILFTPGLDAPPDGSAEVPYGRAGVEAVHVHPGWAGNPPEHDLALLVLDRPVGAHAGSMSLDPAATRRAADHELRQAGYVNNVTGYRQVASSPTLLDRRTEADPGYLHYCAPLSHGDSGSPVWSSVGGRPTILAINTDWGPRHACRNADVGVAMDTDRVSRVRAWQTRDERPPAKADLVVADDGAGPGWLEPVHEPVRDAVAADAPALHLRTTVYNNGPAGVGTAGATYGTSGSAPVRFTATVRRPAENGTRTVARDVPLCTARTEVPAYERALASCTATSLPEDLRPGDEVHVYAEVDPTGQVAQYGDSPLDEHDGPQHVARVRVTASG